VGDRVIVGATVRYVITATEYDAENDVTTWVVAPVPNSLTGGRRRSVVTGRAIRQAFGDRSSWIADRARCDRAGDRVSGGRGARSRGKDGKDWRSLVFARPFASAQIPLNQMISSNRDERLRTLPRVDKLGVTGSSPVPPILPSHRFAGVARFSWGS
jgi:hypothetical protein